MEVHFSTLSEGDEFYLVSPDGPRCERIEDSEPTYHADGSPTGEIALIRARIVGSTTRFDLPDDLLVYVEAPWPWYIVVLGSEDYYVNYHDSKVVKARTPQEAGRKARKGEGHHVVICATFGPFDEKPQEVT